MLLLGLAALFVWHSVRSHDAALSRFSSRVGSPDHEAYLANPVPEDQNRAPAFERAAAGMDLDERWSSGVHSVIWSPESLTAARDELDRNQAGLNAMRSAMKRPSCVWSRQPDIAAGELVGLVRAARLLRLQGLVGVLDSDWNRVSEAVSILDALAECLYSSPNLVGSLVASAVERLQLEVVHAVAASPGSRLELLEQIEASLEQRLGTDRVRWAVAAEGAFALHLLEREKGGSAFPGSWMRVPLQRRMAAALASRWVDFASWSESPLQDLLREPPEAEGARFSVAGLVADMAIVSSRHAVVRLRTNRELLDLARTAVKGRLHGLSQGSYAGAFADRAGLDLLEEGDGSAVLIDAPLESLLRDYFETEGARGENAALSLTVWRLPPPDLRSP